MRRETALVGALARLASPHDGEVIAAARAVGRLLEKRGFGFADLRLPDPVPETVVEAPTNPWAPKPRKNEVPVTLPHQRRAAILLASGFPWDPWKRDFLESMKARSASLTSAQEYKLRECEAMARAGRAAA